MIDGLGPYPAYRDSGLEWLPAVPVHWDVRRNKLFLRERDDRSQTGEEELLTVSQYTGITRRRDQVGDGEAVTRAESLVGYKRVHPDDLVINIMLAWNGSLGVSQLEGITSTAYCVFRRTVDDVEPRFLHYLLRTPLLTGVFKTVSTGVVDSRLRLYPDDFLRLRSVIPPLDEQAAIVRFLDHADRLIRRYIAAKQRLIALLEEERQAIIRRAVTTGLGQTTRPKSSGVDWIGEIPSHWELRKVTAVSTRVTKGTTPTTIKREFTDEGVRFVKVESISRRTGVILHDKCAFIDAETDSLLARSRLAEGDVLVSIAGAIGRIGLVSAGDLPANTNQAVAIVRPNPKLATSAWLGAVFSSSGCQESFTHRSVQSAQANLSLADIGNTPVPLPPVEEQRLITAKLAGRLQASERATRAAESSIELLREHWTRLTADVVTGKLDVREAAASLTEAVEDLDELPEVIYDTDEADVNVPDVPMDEAVV